MAILLIAACLRLVNFSNLSLGNDELSVLARVQYDSFSDLIQLGVKPDVHPAGIQVFAYYWTRIFGETSFALRFPFLLSGLIGIYLIYLLGKKWFGEGAGLLAAAALASLQYSITLTVYARPYAWVLTFALAMVLCWHTYLFEQGGIKSLIGYVIFSSLCMYFHYYSFLLVGIVGLSGLFLINATERKTYLWALLAVGALYLPHLKLFFYHLAMEGSAWMGKPEPDYLLSYLSYIFHFSSPLLIYVVILFLFSVYMYFFKRKPQEKRIEKNRNLFRLLALLFFSFPFIIGFLYSWLKAPVMHTGGLFFSFPFFLLGLFSFEWESKVKVWVVSCFLILSCASLILNREHFSLFYNRSADQIVKDMKRHEKEVGKGETIYLGQFHDPYYIDYYLPNKEIAMYAYDLDSLTDIAVLRNFLKNSREKYVSLGWLSRPVPAVFLPIIREYYPYIIKRKNYFISEHYVFSKEAPGAHDPLFTSTLDFESPNEFWAPIEKFKQDSLIESGNFSGFLSKEDTFGPTLQINLAEYKVNPYDELWFRAKIKLKEPEKNLQLVIQISQEGEEDIWRSANTGPFTTQKNGWNAIHYFTRLQHLGLGKGPHTLKAYLWNPEKTTAWFDKLEIRIEKGNPNLYGLVEPLYK